jgi:hypothetical protein
LVVLSVVTEAEREQEEGQGSAAQEGEAARSLSAGREESAPVQLEVPDPDDDEEQASELVEQGDSRDTKVEEHQKPGEANDEEADPGQWAQPVALRAMGWSRPIRLSHHVRTPRAECAAKDMIRLIRCGSDASV